MDNQNTQQNTQNGYGVTADELLDFLKDNMVTQLEFKQEMSHINENMAKFGEEMKEMSKKINQVKLDIVDHVTDKLADLKGDLVILTRKEDNKLISLVDLMISKKMIKQEESKQIRQMDPFPQLIV